MPQNIRRIFLMEGMLIGMAGAGIGLVLGLGLALAQREWAIVPMQGAESFLIDAYPVTIEALDVVAIAVVALLLCVLASVYPAYRASQVEPARAVALDG